jgi:hypothetical protein
MKARLKLRPLFSSAPAGQPSAQPPRPPNPAPFAPPQFRATPLNAASAPCLSPRCRHPSSLLYPRRRLSIFPYLFFLRSRRRSLPPCASTPLQEEASRGLSPAQARRRSASNAGAVTAVLRVAGGAREAGAPLLEGPVVWTSLGPLPRWVSGSTTRWAPGTTRLALHGT